MIEPWTALMLGFISGGLFSYAVGFLTARAIYRPAWPLARNAIEAVEYMKRRTDRAERLLAEVVIAAGGEVSIHRDRFTDPRRSYEFLTQTDESDDSLRIRVELTRTH